MKKSILFYLLFFTFSLTAQISNEGLLAYYPLDGNTNDLGPNAFHGTMNGGSFGENRNGDSNSALILNGINDFVNLGAFASAFRENLEKMTIVFDIRFDKEIDSQTILSLGTQGENLQTNVFEIEYENDRLQIETETGNSATNHELELSHPQAFFDQEWHQLMIVLDGDKVTLCTNGFQVFQGIYRPNESLSNQLFLGCFGGSSSSPCCFLGASIDELQFYDRVLDKSEFSVNTSNLSIDPVLHFFPNPTSDKVFVQLDKNYPSLQIQITDITGRTLSTEALKNKSQLELELNGPAGIYFLQIEGSDAIKSNFKVIKI